MPRCHFIHKNSPILCFFFSSFNCNGNNKTYVHLPFTHTHTHIHMRKKKQFHNVNVMIAKCDEIAVLPPLCVFFPVCCLRLVLFLPILIATHYNMNREQCTQLPCRILFMLFNFASCLFVCVCAHTVQKKQYENK